MRPAARHFCELTSNNLKKLMAVMLDDKIISAANIQAAISRDGIISRESGYTEEEFNYLHLDPQRRLAAGAAGR